MLFALAESIKRRVLVLLPSIFKDELFLALPFGLDSLVNKFKFEFMAVKLRFSEKCDQDTTHINTVRFQRDMQIVLDVNVLAVNTSNCVGIFRSYGLRRFFIVELFWNLKKGVLWLSKFALTLCTVQYSEMICRKIAQGLRTI